MRLKEPPAAPVLGEAVSARYPAIPPDYWQFLTHVGELASPEETIFFLCDQNFHPADELTFNWNVWERISLDTAAESNEPGWADEIKQFWDRYLPIAFSLTNGYAYLAVDTEAASYGSIVYGREPEFEECVLLAHSLEELLTVLGGIITGAINPDELPHSAAWLDFSRR